MSFIMIDGAVVAELTEHETSIELFISFVLGIPSVGKYTDSC